ncbi:transposase [Streptomyces sp. NBC_01718]|uniref:transposase n=1 Tax=unclassified Streptomyces TaxID=2593676 RepID=UPI00352DF926
MRRSFRPTRQSRHIVVSKQAACAADSSSTSERWGPPARQRCRVRAVPAVRHKSAASPSAIESANARIRKAVRACGHFPNEAAALKCVYIAVTSWDATGQGGKYWAMRGTPAVQVFDIAFVGRFSLGRR